jgi:mannitol/fructose-specific phosphotransferase system IIA component (Ntr-type)
MNLKGLLTNLKADHSSAKNKEEVIQHLISLLDATPELKTDIFSHLIAQESLFSPLTLGTNLSFFRCICIIPATLSSAITLKEPVQMGNETVKYACLVIGAAHDLVNFSTVSDALKKALMDSTLRYLLTRCLKQSTVTELIKAGAYILSKSKQDLQRSNNVKEESIDAKSSSRSTKEAICRTKKNSEEAEG